MSGSSIISQAEEWIRASIGWIHGQQYGTSDRILEGEHDEAVSTFKDEWRQDGIRLSDREERTITQGSASEFTQRLAKDEETPVFEKVRERYISTLDIKDSWLSGVIRLVKGYGIHSVEKISEKELNYLLKDSLKEICKTHDYISSKFEKEAGTARNILKNIILSDGQVSISAEKETYSWGVAPIEALNLFNSFFSLPKERGLSDEKLEMILRYFTNHEISDKYLRSNWVNREAKERMIGDEKRVEKQADSPLIGRQFPKRTLEEILANNNTLLYSARMYQIMLMSLLGINEKDERLKLAGILEQDEKSRKELLKYAIKFTDLQKDIGNLRKKIKEKAYGEADKKIFQTEINNELTDIRSRIKNIEEYDKIKISERQLKEQLVDDILFSAKKRVMIQGKEELARIFDEQYAFIQQEVMNNIDRPTMFENAINILKKIEGDYAEKRKRKREEAGEHLKETKEAMQSPDTLSAIYILRNFPIELNTEVDNYLARISLDLAKEFLKDENIIRKNAYLNGQFNKLKKRVNNLMEVK